MQPRNGEQGGSQSQRATQGQASLGSQSLPVTEDQAGGVAQEALLTLPIPILTHWKRVPSKSAPSFPASAQPRPTGTQEGPGQAWGEVSHMFRWREAL